MKVLKGIFYTFLTVFLLLVFYFFFGGAICNDIKASHIEKEYAKMELPVGVETMDWLDYAKEVNPHEHMVFMKLCATLEEPISSEGYFIISQYYNPFTEMDLRGT